MDTAVVASLLDNVENSVWHAFDLLALEADGSATKSKLKVRDLTISCCSIVILIGGTRWSYDFWRSLHLSPMSQHVVNGCVRGSA